MSSRKRQQTILATATACNGAMVITLPGVPRCKMPEMGSVLLHTGQLHSAEVTRQQENGRWYVMVRIYGDRNWQRLMQLQCLFSAEIARQLAAGWSPTTPTSSQISLEVRAQFFQLVAEAAASQKGKNSTVSGTLLTPSLLTHAKVIRSHAGSLFALPAAV